MPPQSSPLPPLGPEVPPTAPWVRASAIPEVEYVIDLNNGATTPLPDAIIQSSLGNNTDEVGARTHYAVSPDGAQLAYVGTGGEGALESSSPTSTGPGSGR